MNGMPRIQSTPSTTITAGSICSARSSSYLPQRSGSPCCYEGEGCAHTPLNKVDDRPPLSEAVQGVITPALLVTVIFGLYIGLHGQLTPGGAFREA